MVLKENMEGKVMSKLELNPEMKLQLNSNNSNKININYAIILLIIGIIIRAIYQQKVHMYTFQHDWPGHVEMLKHIAETWTLPLPSKGLEFPQQPLYYLISAAIYSIASGLGFSDFDALSIIRGLSFLCSVVFLIYGYKFVGLLTENKRIKSIAMIFLALTPSLVYLSGRINNDAIVMVLSAAGLYYIVKSYQNKFNKYFYPALICTTLLFATKISTAGMQVLFFGLLLLAYKNSSSSETKKIQRALYIFCLVGLFLLSWTLWRTYLPIDGKFHMVNSSSYYPGQKLGDYIGVKYFASFNFISLLQTGQSHVFGEDSIRHSFITYQYGTMLFGEFDYVDYTKRIDGFKESMQSVLLFGLIFLIGFVSYIIKLYKESSLKIWVFIALLLNLALVLKFMLTFTSICNTDFRYFVSSFPIFGYVFAHGINSISKSKIVIGIIDGILILLVLSELFFFSLLF